MSDTDDTEILLLIPPDFFHINDSRSDITNIETEEIICSCTNLPILGHSINFLDSMSTHFHLPPKQQSELDNINARITQIERNFSADSEISTISNSTVRSKYGNGITNVANSVRNENILQNGIVNTPSKLVSSTPKNMEKYTNYPTYRTHKDENGVLKEIDKFLEEKKYSVRSNWNLHNYNTYRSISEPLSLPNPDITPNRTSIEKSKSPVFVHQRDDPLLSLSEIWENNGIQKDVTAISNVQEERLRRQHCEKTIQALQSKLLEYQQKISVAIQVDKAKDAAISKIQIENNNLKQQLDKLEEKLENIEIQYNEIDNRIKLETEDLKASKDCLEKELTQALSLASKFQEKNKILEINIESLSKATNDVSSIYKNQINEMEIRVSNTQRSEEIAIEELRKLQDRLARAQVEEEKAAKQAALYKKELEILQTSTKRVETLDKQNKNLSETVSHLNEKEKKLQKDLETQRTLLKTHYQQQLEKVVEQKLIEFQTQLDTVEETLKSEAKERERTIAERAIKQLEMINEKSEQEISLLLEKHREEVELYRIQLINASKKIQELEEKLHTYRHRRVDIAEKLHSVMETQWQKALEILTSPNANTSTSQQPINPRAKDRDKLDGLSVCTDSGITKPENESFDTPTSSRNKKYNKNNNDRLQAYIELLLSKSPRDLENLDGILAIPKNDTNLDSKYDKDRHSHSNSKPPWK